MENKISYTHVVNVNFPVLFCYVRCAVKNRKNTYHWLKHSHSYYNQNHQETHIIFWFWRYLTRKEAYLTF